jgi:hypothetical protein
VEAGRLTHEHQVGVCITAAHHHLGTRLGKRAAGAAGPLRRPAFQLLTSRLRVCRHRSIVSGRSDAQWPQPQLPPQQPPPIIAPSGREVANDESSRVTTASPQEGQRTDDSSPSDTSSSNVSEQPLQRYS